MKILIKLLVILILASSVPAAPAAMAQKISPASVSEALVKVEPAQIGDSKGVLTAAEYVVSETADEKQIRYTWPPQQCGGWHISSGASRPGQYWAQNNQNLDVNAIVADCHLNFTPPGEGWVAEAASTQWWTARIEQDTAQRRYQVESLGIVPVFAWQTNTAQEPTAYDSWHELQLGWPATVGGLRLVAFGGSKDWMGFSDISLTIKYRREVVTPPAPTKVPPTPVPPTVIPTIAPTPIPTSTSWPRPQVIRFDVSACSVTAGQTFVVNWTTAFVNSVILQRNGVAISYLSQGVVSENLGVGKYTYRLEAMGPGGSVTPWEITVEVKPVPPIPSPTPTPGAFSNLLALDRGEVPSCKSEVFIPQTSGPTGPFASCPAAGVMVALVEGMPSPEAVATLTALPACKSIDQIVGQLAQFCQNPAKRWQTDRGGLVNGAAWDCNRNLLSGAQQTGYYMLELRDVPWQEIARAVAAALTAVGLAIEAPVVIAAVLTVGGGYTIYVIVEQTQELQASEQWRRINRLREGDQWIAFGVGGGPASWFTPIEVEVNGGSFWDNFRAEWFNDVSDNPVYLVELSTRQSNSGQEYANLYVLEDGAHQYRGVTLAPRLLSSDVLFAGFTPMHPIEAANWVAGYGGGTSRWPVTTNAWPIRSWSAADDITVNALVRPEDVNSEIVANARYWNSDWASDLPEGEYNVWRVTEFQDVPANVGLRMQVAMEGQLGTYDVSLSRPMGGETIVYSGPEPIRWVMASRQVIPEPISGSPLYLHDEGEAIKSEEAKESRDPQRENQWKNFWNKDRRERAAPGGCPKYETWLRTNVETTTEGMISTVLTYIFLDRSGEYEVVDGAGVQKTRVGLAFYAEPKNPTIFGDLRYQGASDPDPGRPKLFKDGDFTLQTSGTKVNATYTRINLDPCVDPYDYLPPRNGGPWPLVP